MKTKRIWTSCAQVAVAPTDYPSAIDFSLASETDHRDQQPFGLALEYPR